MTQEEKLLHLLDEHIRNISHEIEQFKRSQEADPIKSASDPIKSFSDPIKSYSDPIKEKLYRATLQDNTLNYAEYGQRIGVSEATVKRRLGELKKAGLIVRVGSNKNGHWQITGKEDNA